MSAEGTLRAAKIFIKKQELGVPAEPILLGLLQTSNKPILQLIYDVAFQCFQDQQVAQDRTLCVLFHSTLIHLADDIADGDCDYLEEPESQGVTAVYSLMHLFNLSMVNTGIQSRDIIDSLLQVGAAQHRELSCSEWTISESTYAADKLNGEQFKAYFHIASLGSNLEQEMTEAGYAYGIANHIANDILDQDTRFYSLSPQEQQQLIYWSLELLSKHHLDMPSASIYTTPIKSVLNGKRN